MALTERAIKRKPVAVITVEAPLDDLENYQADFEWFNTTDAAKEWIDQWTEFAKEDTTTYSLLDNKDDPALAYLTILIPDTATLAVGSALVFPDNDQTQAWLAETTGDITNLFEKRQEAPKKKVTVKAPRARRVAGKVSTPSESEVPAPQKRAPRKIKVEKD